MKTVNEKSFLVALDLKRLRKLSNVLTWGKLKHSEAGGTVDVGLKSRDKVSHSFFKNLNIKPSHDLRIPVYVKTFSDSNGDTKIDQIKLTYLINLLKLKKAFDKQEVLTGTIYRQKHGGFVIRSQEFEVGERREAFYFFLPNHLSGLQGGRDVIGKEIQYQINSMDLNLESVVVKDFNRKNQLQRFFDEIKINSLVQGKVVRIVDFGAVVRVGKLDCFLSKRELSFNLLEEDKDGKNLLSNTQHLTDLMVVNKNPSNYKVYLSAKAIFDKLENYIREGDVLKAEIRDKRVNGYSLILKVGEDVRIKAFLPNNEVDGKCSYYAKKFKSASEIQVSVLNIRDTYLPLVTRRPLLHNFGEDVMQSYPLGTSIETYPHTKFKDRRFLMGDRTNFLIKLISQNKLDRGLNSIAFGRSQDSKKIKVDLINYQFRGGYILARPSFGSCMAELISVGKYVLKAKVRRISNNLGGFEIFNGKILRAIILEIDGDPDLSENSEIRMEAVYMENGETFIKLSKANLI